MSIRNSVRVLLYFIITIFISDFNDLFFGIFSVLPLCGAVLQLSADVWLDKQIYANTHKGKRTSQKCSAIMLESVHNNDTGFYSATDEKARIIIIIFIYSTFEKICTETINIKFCCQCLILYIIMVILKIF